jgi:hypothetical protein
MVLGRCFDYEGKALMNRITALVKEAAGGQLALSTMRAHGGKGLTMTRKWVLD